MAFACSSFRWLAAICVYMIASLSIAVFLKLSDSQAGTPQVWSSAARRLGGSAVGVADAAVPTPDAKDAIALASLRFEHLAEMMLVRQERKGGSQLELPEDYFNIFDDLSCQGPFPSAAQAKEELKRSMRAPPSKVIDEMVRRGIVENQTNSKTFRDNLANTPVLSSASYYLAAVHATFEPKAATYSVCAAVTAIEFKATTALSQYIEAVQEEIDGEEDCDCGFFSCSRCTAIQPIESLLPEFKPDVVSLEQQHALGNWLESRVATLILGSRSPHVIV